MKKNLQLKNVEIIRVLFISKSFEYYLFANQLKLGVGNILNAF